MRNLTLLILTIFLTGCSILAKPAPQMRYFMLGEGDFKNCEKKDEKVKNAVFVEQTRALDAFDTRNIIMIDNNAQISAFESAKWITTPSDMVYKSILSAISGDCELKVSFDKQNLTLKTTILLLQSNQQEAQITLGFTILNRGEAVKSGIISSSKPVANQTPQDTVNALNLALNEILGQILKELSKGDK